MKIACTDANQYVTDNKRWTNHLVQLGIPGMEIAVARLPESQEGLDEVISYACAKGLAVNLHAPFGINNIAAADDELREFSINNVLRSIDLSAKYGLGVVTFHPGRLSGDDDSAEATWARMWDAVTRIANHAKEKQVYVAIENMERRPYELVFTVEDLNLFAPFGENNPYFGVTIDFAHYASHGIGLPELGKLKLPIHDVHLSQLTNGIMHSQLQELHGTPDITEVCRLLADYGYKGLLVLEVGPQVQESAETLAEALKLLKL